MAYVEIMKAIRFELAAEYLLMAALLAEIKSRTLLPRQTQEDDDEEDPRAQLILKLQEYERYKEAAEAMDELPRLGRDLYSTAVEPPELETSIPEPDVELKELLVVFAEVMHRADMFKTHQVMLEKLSTRERMAQVLERLQSESFVPFIQLFTAEEGRLGVVVTFLALMELIKESLVEIVQNEAYGPIHIKAREQSLES
jgi:segregation and condensation protein A